MVVLSLSSPIHASVCTFPKLYQCSSVVTLGSKYKLKKFYNNIIFSFFFFFSVVVFVTSPFFFFFFFFFFFR